MIPLVCDVDELRYVKAEIVAEIEEVFSEKAATIPYLIGTMIEIPRAAVTSDEIAMEADFFSFGTNDMTQMGFGFSRDDAGKFLQEYEDKGLLKPNPFHSLDVKGIGKLVKLSAKLGRETNPGLVLGVCGEHGGDPESIAFFSSIGLDYVSCSPLPRADRPLGFRASSDQRKQSKNVSREKCCVEQHLIEKARIDDLDPGLFGMSCCACALVVRFFSVIGQSALRACPGCPILLGYRTIYFAIMSWLSDSSRLSDNLLCDRAPVVRFFSVIGQPQPRTHMEPSGTVIFLLIGYYSYIVRILLSTRRKCGSI